MAARFVGTSRLSNIIQMVTISNQTGILRVTRNQNGMREMGQIRFIQGEPVSALLGSLTGGAALNALTVWGECMYAFDENEGEPEAQGYDPNAHMAPMPPVTPSPTPASSWPSYGYPSTTSLNSFTPIPPEYGASSSSDGYGYSYQDPAAPMSALYGGGYVQPDQQQPPQSPYGGGATATAMPLRPEQLATRPRRTTPSMNVDQLPLDRRERMVLLLVDGQRSVTDLVRLTRRHENDVYAVLNHLRILGLITL